MKNTFEYKSLIGSIEVDSGKLILHGRITGINDLVTYEAGNLKDLKKAFQDAVDDYIKTCLSAGKEYEKSYNGTFNIRIKPELH